MEKSELTEKLKGLFDVSTELWFEIVNDGGGHPGMIGPSSEDTWNEDLARLGSTIKTLEECRDKGEWK